MIGAGIMSASFILSAILHAMDVGKEQPDVWKAVFISLWRAVKTQWPYLGFYVFLFFFFRAYSVF